MRTLIACLLGALLVLSGCTSQPGGGLLATDTARQAPSQSAFTRNGGHPEKVLVAVIGEARTTLDIAIYSLTNDEIVDAILAAQKRGVHVRIMTDREQAASKSQSADLQKLETAGIPVKQNKHTGLMHLKVTIVDHKVATTGSFNYSANAATRNDEVLVVLREPKLAEDWTQVFDQIWSDTKAYENWP